MSEEILYCPFCGSTDIQLVHGAADFWFRCYDCTARGPNGVDRESALIQWNTRAASPLEETAE